MDRSHRESAPSPEEIPVDQQLGHNGTPVHFASLRAENIATILLFNTIKDRAPPKRYQARCLVEIDDSVEYRFMLGARSSTMEWIIGAGGGSSNVDFLLCPPSETPGVGLIRKFIDEVHACFHVHPLSGALMINQGLCEPIERPSIDGAGSNAPRKWRESNCCGKPDNELNIGPFKFSITYAQFSPDELARFRRVRSQLMEDHGGFASTHLDPIPMPSHYLSHGIWHHRLFYRTQEAKFSAGVLDETGRPVMVKEMPYNGSTAGRVRQEMEYLEELGGEPSTGVIGYLDHWCEHSNPPCQMVEDGLVPETSEAADTVYYSSPLPEFAFHTMPWDATEPETRLRHFYQTLVGLGVIHKAGLVHAFIHPKSLVLVPTVQSTGTPGGTSSGSIDLYARFEAAVTDLSHAKSQFDPFVTPSTSSVWIAPEVWTDAEHAPYTTKSDIWSLGLCWYNTYRTVEPVDAEVDRMGYAYLRRELEGLKHDSWYDDSCMKALFELMEQMLEWDPAKRPSVEQALAHHAWDPIRSAEGERDTVIESVEQADAASPEKSAEEYLGSSGEEGSGESSRESSRESSQEEGAQRPAKRARLLSPEADEGVENSQQSQQSQQSQE